MAKISRLYPDEMLSLLVSKALVFTFYRCKASSNMLPLTNVKISGIFLL